MFYEFFRESKGGFPYRRIPSNTFWVSKDYGNKKKKR